MALPIVPKLETTQLDSHVFGNTNPHNADELYDVFHITSIEHYKHNYQLPIPPHRRSVYFLFFVTKGEARRSKNLNDYLIKKNEMYMIPAYEITSMESISEDLEGFYCHFHPDIFNQNRLSVNMDVDFPFFDAAADPLIKIQKPEQIIRSFQALYEEYRQEDLRRKSILALHLITLLTLILFEYKEQAHFSHNAASAITIRYKHLLSIRVMEFRRVSECAQALGVSQNHLNKCVKEITGKSALELLQEMRVLEAKVLLRQSDLKISDIAYRLGGYAVSDFGRFFKNQTGLSPRDYRNSML